MKTRFNLDPRTGNLRLYDTPEPSKTYVLGGDVSDGVRGGDFSCGQVLCVETFRQVATWHGLIEPSEFGKELWMLGHYFNTALLMPEVNASGASTLSYLIKNNYPNLYRMRLQESLVMEESERVGWRTNIHTRRLMLDDLRSCVKDNVIQIQDVDTLDELKTFVKNRMTGKMEAAPGNHDDRVMALAIAVQGVVTLRDEIKSRSQEDQDYMDVIRSRDGTHQAGLGRGGYSG